MSKNRWLILWLKSWRWLINFWHLRWLFLWLLTLALKLTYDVQIFLKSLKFPWRSEHWQLGTSASTRVNESAASTQTEAHIQQLLAQVLVYNVHWGHYVRFSCLLQTDDCVIITCNNKYLVYRFILFFFTTVKPAISTGSAGGQAGWKQTRPGPAQNAAHTI